MILNWNHVHWPRPQNAKRPDNFSHAEKMKTKEE